VDSKFNAAEQMTTDEVRPGTSTASRSARRLKPAARWSLVFAGLIVVLGLGVLARPAPWKITLGPGKELFCIPSSHPFARGFPRGIGHAAFVAGMDNQVRIDSWSLRLGGRIYLLRWET